MSEETTNIRERSSEQNGVPFIGISRHRLGIDGEGVTTLVAFHGCSLRCKYCLNSECFDPDAKVVYHTRESLLEAVKQDDVYFRATNGGITFGGGEPSLQIDFIRHFKRICPNEWKIRIETSLQFHCQDTELLAPVIDEWIVDVKTAEPESYREYTGGDYQQVVKNLHYLVDEFHVPKDKFVIRIPIIPGYTDRAKAETTEQIFRNQGFTRFDIFEYQTELPEHYRTNGKAKCEALKAIRKELAEANGIEYADRECSHQGDCTGTCPLCEFELEKLSADLRAKDASRIEVSDEAKQRIENINSAEPAQDADEPLLPMGIPAFTDDIKGTMVGLEDDIPLEGEAVPEPPQPPTKKILFKECAVAGTSFHLKYNDDIWDELEVGQEVSLVRERKNKYDKNAVAIALADDYDGDPDNFDFDIILGYVPKTENEEISKMLDMGWEDVFYTTLSTVKTHGNINDRLRISIFIKSKEPKFVRPDLLRIHSLGFSECREMQRELSEKGFTHFRWGGFPVWERNLPVKEERIVLLRRQSNRVLMYLTKVLAIGDDCINYLSEDEVFAVDDCSCFVLTNICGPLLLDLKDLDFLGVDTLGKRDVGDYVTPAEDGRLRDIFKRLAEAWFRTDPNNLDADPSLDDPEDDNSEVEKVIEWITKPVLQFYYRDTSAQLSGEYSVGEILRTDFTVDLSEKFFKPIRKTRFLVASAHIDDHCTPWEPGVNPTKQDMEWRRVSIPRNSYFLVLDIYEPEDTDKRQILLLHVPTEAVPLREDLDFIEAVEKIEKWSPNGCSLIDAARYDFDTKLKSTVFPRQKDQELIERMKRPIGIIKRGKPVSLEMPIDARQLVIDFIREKLGGEIDKLANFDFSSLANDPKYGSLAGPNTICNYAIIKAIFTVAFGDKWLDLGIETLDNYTYQISPIIITQRLFGSLINDEYFMGLDKYKNVVTPDLMREAFEVEHLCHTIGNMLVWPNKSCLYRIYDEWQMRGYFDRMLRAMYASMARHGKEVDAVKWALNDNRPLMLNYQGEEGFRNYVKDQLLTDFVDNGFVPKETFVGVSIAAKDFWPTQLPLAIHEMYVFCKHFIPNRTQKIISILRERL